MSKRLEFRKEMKIQLSLDEICEHITSLPMKDRIYVIHNILGCYSAGEDPLRALAEYEYKEERKEGADFAEMASDPVFATMSEAYKEVSEHHKHIGGLWQQFLRGLDE